MVVAGLNPHSGEDGLFGDEEIKYILPTIEEARRRGFNLIDRAVPPDTAFFRAYDGQFDAAIAMYHDQGHIAVKMLGIWLGVNVTLGLPIIRTSVDHGTNFGKAGKGTADPRSMNAAMKLATVMARSRKAAK
jgi:4-hydroxythreonine-4-phosphate dehydrogenase